MNNFLHLCKKELLKNGIVNAKKELDWFVEKNSTFTKEQILLNEINIDNKLKEKIIHFVQRRNKQEPFQYIVGLASFFGRDFHVNSNVLIPRPETETIIYNLKVNSKVYNNALDIGTGSGNLALTLLLEKLANNVVAIDKSRGALKIAEHNAKKHGVDKIKFIQHDFIKGEITKKFDLIVSNPPYITLSEYTQLNLEIKKYEPSIALTDFQDGLLFYRKIAQNLDKILCNKGTLLLETGLEKHKDKINKIFNRYSSKWYKDLNGNYRVIKIEKN